MFGRRSMRRGGAFSSRVRVDRLLRYGDLLATDARGRALRSWLVLDGRTILLRVDTAGARYPIRIDPLIENAMLTGGSGSEAALFGYSVALSADGNTALIGHKYASRAAWVFTRSGSTWEPVGEPLTVNEEGVAGGEPCAEEPGEVAAGAASRCRPTARPRLSVARRPMQTAAPCGCSRVRAANGRRAPS